MKKVMIALGAFAMISLASCKKDYTCECTINGETQEVNYEGVKKSDAEDSCDSYETQLNAAGGDASCELK